MYPFLWNGFFLRRRGCCKSMGACVSSTVKLKGLPIVRRPPSVHMLLEIENRHGVRLCCPVRWESTSRLGPRLPTQELNFKDGCRRGCSRAPSMPEQHPPSGTARSADQLNSQDGVNCL